MNTRAAVLHKKISIYNAFSSLSLSQKIATAVFAAALTGLLAQVRISLPFTPVPMTLQVLGVIGSGLLMGGVWGAISMAIYAIIGALGMPWFTGMSGGVSHILGPTGGYIIGFIVAAYLSGWMAERLENAIGSFAASIVGIITIYIFGVIGLMFHGMSLTHAIAAGVIPFILVDTIKGIIAGGFSAAVR